MDCTAPAVQTLHSQIEFLHEPQSRAWTFGIVIAAAFLRSSSSRYRKSQITTEHQPRHQSSIVTVIVVANAIVLSLTSIAIAQPPSHSKAENALARIVLKKDFDEQLKFHSREVVTISPNNSVPGLNGLMFMRWKGDDPGTEVMASVQWFERKADLLRFYETSKERANFKLGEFEEAALWAMGKSAYQWTDGEHFHVSLGGSPDPPPEMLKAWLKLVPSKVAEVEKQPGRLTGKTREGALDYGYSRRGNFIYFRNQRIDEAGSHDIDDFAVAVRHKLKLASDVDAESFTVLSREYSKDRNKVYYMWISPSRFWVVEVPGADPATFEAVAFELAKDRNHVWIRDTIVKGANPKRIKSFFGYRIWTDSNSLWNGERRIEGADHETFERIGKSEFGYYRDSKRVYSYFGRLKVVDGADPRTFRIPKKR